MTSSPDLAASTPGDFEEGFASGGGVIIFSPGKPVGGPGFQMQVYYLDYNTTWQYHTQQETSETPFSNIVILPK